MKRFIILAYFTIFGLSVGFAQSGRIIDDIYVTPNDAQMVQAAKSVDRAKVNKTESNQSTIYRNGAKEIVFVDRNGNRTTAVSDTVYVVDGDVVADSLVTDNSAREEGKYLNGFKGSSSDLDYAERIRRFHNPKYTITIADPGYNDIYFLDDDYWNVYIDGMYATITPTWNNPYWWNYQYSPFSYSSWAWRNNWGYPYYGGYYGLGSYYGGWYDPMYSGYYGWGGWNDPWYSGYYGLGYPYYGGYYGWGGYYDGYPYYGGYYGYPYGYGYNYSGGLADSQNRRGSSRGTFSTPASGRRTSAISRQNILSASNGRYTTVSSSRSGTVDAINGTRTGRNLLGTGGTYTTTGRNSVVSRGNTNERSVYSPDVNTRTRTGAVRSAEQWNEVRSSRTSTGTSTIINRSNPATSGNSSTRIYDNGRSSTSYSRSYDTGTSRSTQTYSVPSRSSSSTESYSGGRTSSGSYGGSSSSSAGRSSGGRR
ncbi:MAG: hypothetical protein ACYC2P_04120 [Paludibacteraceae bacterium]